MKQLILNNETQGLYWTMKQLILNNETINIEQWKNNNIEQWNNKYYKGTMNNEQQILNNEQQGWATPASCGCTTSKTSRLYSEC
jgi:hypothetical protein